MSENGVVSTPDPQHDEVRIRRAPKIPVFLIVGGALGAVVTFIVTLQFPVDPNVGLGPLLGYFSLFGITGGVLLGAIVAIILDRVSIRRARQATAEREIVPPAELPD